MEEKNSKRILGYILGIMFGLIFSIPWLLIFVKINYFIGYLSILIVLGLILGYKIACKMEPQKQAAQQTEQQFLSAQLSKFRPTVPEQKHRQEQNRRHRDTVEYQDHGRRCGNADQRSGERDPEHPQKNQEFFHADLTLLSDIRV